MVKQLRKSTFVGPRPHLKGGVSVTKTFGTSDVRTHSLSYTATKFCTAIKLDAMKNFTVSIDHKC